MISILFVFAVAFSVVSCSGSRLTAEQKSARRAAMQEQVQTALQSMNFRVVFREMTPQRGPSRTFTTDYDITVKGDTLISYLPYFGQVYVPTMGSTESEHVDKILGLERLRNEKKGYTQLNMSVRRDGEGYLYRLFVSDDGSAALHVSCMSRDNIEYAGDLDL